MSPQIYCPSGHCACPTPQRCLQDCNFDVAELPTAIDTPLETAERAFWLTDSAAQPRAPWYETFPVIRVCAVVAVSIMAAPTVFGFVLAAINRFNH